MREVRLSASSANTALLAGAGFASHAALPPRSPRLELLSPLKAMAGMPASCAA